MKGQSDRTSITAHSRRHSKTFRTVILSLAVVVVFVVSYLLILPAITLEQQKAQEQAGIDITPEVLDDGELSFEGKGYDINASFEKKAQLPKDTELSVKEITEKSDRYDAYYNKALAAVNNDSEADVTKLSFAKFYDISLMADGSEVEPEDHINVTISYDEGMAARDADHVRIIHFKEDPKTEEVETEVLKDSRTDITIKKDKMTEASFEAESFSVYAVVYTVDFHWEDDGQTYDYSIQGEDAVSLKELAEALHIPEKVSVSADQFLNEIDDVSFSNTDLMQVVKVKKNNTLGGIKAEKKIRQDFAAWQDQGEVMKRNAKKFSAGDWALISLKPFTSEEELTITFFSGESMTITVTDAQDATMNDDGTVQTIKNPSGTTIDLFDYWVDNSLKDSFAREAWTGYYDGWYYHDDNDYEWYKSGTLLGEGNDAGINAGHMFKFSPAWAGTVYDGTIPNKETVGLLSPTRNPTNVSYANDGDRRYFTGGVNSYTGSGDPRQGLVEGTLSGGYPKLTDDNTAGTNGESLEYLFKAENTNYKDCYKGVDQLLYVDKDGYYTYDSRDYKADFDKNNKTFALTEQTSSDTEVRGFWPFGQQKFWLGMHMNTQFSMPANGQVLNPKDEYKDMQFEFSGDDDTWLYIDGVLVGDGGGIHNRTEIDINFATGKVLVTGKKDTNHTGTFEETKYLDDIFRAAGKYNDDDWEDIGDGSGHKRFKAGTYHTFDMFYLERGGGESNLYIHYNLVSTEDFTAHKSYEGFADDEQMQRDQFKFEMIGLDGQYQSVWNPQTQTADVTLVDANGRAIMPTQGRESGAGTFEDPKKVYSESAWKDEEGHTIGGTVFTTGVTENGDVRFGTAEINQDEMSRCDDGRPSLYRYIIREIVPDDAKNAAGITWADATEEQKAAGGFVKDQVKYDGRIYYMTARVTSWDQVGSDGTTYKQYGLSKTYYTDNTFSVVDNDTKFISFHNRYAPDKGKVEFTKTDGANHPLAGAQFTLYTDKACTKIAKDLGDPETGEAGTDQVKTSGTNGKIKFENMAAPRTYYMKETGVPAGYEPNDTLYKVIIEDSKDLTKYSRIIVDGDEDQTPVTKIVNVKSGDLSVVKEWQNLDGKPVSGGSYTARVKLQRKHYDDHTIWHQVVFTIKIQNRDDLVYTYTAEHISGDVSVDWWDTNQDIAGFEVKDGSGNNLEYTRSNYWDDTNHKNRKVVVSTVAPVINITVEYPAGVSWLFNSEHTPWMKDVSVAGSGANYEPIEDETFNASTDEFHFATLSSSNDWSKTWTLGAGKDFPASDGTNPYLYYVVEVDEQGNPLTPQVMTEDGYQLAGYSSNNTDGVANQGSITVYNQVNDTGVELPHTGGSGTRIIYVFGAMLLCLSAVLMFLRRRRARLQ